MCFLAATTFWFLNALNKDYSTRLSYPIRFEFDDSSYVSLAPLPRKVDMNVSGYGWNLFRKNFLAKTQPLTYHIANPLKTKYLTGITLLPSITEQLEDVRVNYIIEDTVFFDFDRRVTKKVALRVDSAHIGLKEGFQLTSRITIDPDTLTLVGPASLLKAIPESIFIDIPAKSVDENYEEDIPVDYIQNSLISADYDKVQVSFAVSGFVREALRLPIQLQNLPTNNPPSLSANQVEITYWVRQEDAGKARPEDFKLIADLNKVNNADSTVTLYIETRLDYIRDPKLVGPSVKVMYGKQ
jgi:hypothetical protein